MNIQRIITSLILCSVFIAGCGEYITYSKQSRARGLDYMQSNQTEEARGAFRDAVRQNPRDYQSYHYLGKLYEQDKSYSTAISHYRTSLSVQNVTDEGREDTAFKLKTIDALAQCLSVADSHDAEVNKLEQSAAASGTGDEYLVLAKTFAARGDADSAIDAYAKAAAKTPQSFYIAKEQGLYLEQIGHKPLAEQALRRAYRLNQTDEAVNTALRRLGIIPGPALKEETELQKPLLPKGPIPELFPDRPSEPASTPPPGASPSPKD